MVDGFTDVGLVASLGRFGRLYANTWRREVEHAGGWSATVRSLLAPERASKLRAMPHRNGDFAFALTRKRAAVLLATGVLTPALMTWNHVGFWLDDLLFREWRDEKVHRPTFIVGNARSGTTWFHRVLAHDTLNFTCPEVWEMVFAQSVTWRVLFHKLGHLDAQVGRPVGSLMSLCDRALFGSNQMRKIHASGLFFAEEDEWMMMNIGACQLSALIYPLVDDFSELIYFDKSLDQASQDSIFNYYKNCVKRHLYARRIVSADCQKYISGLGTKGVGSTGADAAAGSMVRANSFIFKSEMRYLSKNPTFTLRLKSLLRAFPDAEVVVMVRDPFQAIPSMVSYISHCWHTFASPTERFPFNKELTGMCDLHYSYPIQVAEELPDKARQFCWMHYELLTNDLVKSVSALYRHLNLRRFTSQMAAVLDTEARISRSFATSHRYSIQDTCGQTKEEFVQQHREAFTLYPAYLSDK